MSGIYTSKGTYQNPAEAQPIGRMFPDSKFAPNAVRKITDASYRNPLDTFLTLPVAGEVKITPAQAAAHIAIEQKRIQAARNDRNQLKAIIVAFIGIGAVLVGAEFAMDRLAPRVGERPNHTLLPVQRAYEAMMGVPAAPQKPAPRAGHYTP